MNEFANGFWCTDCLAKGRENRPAFQGRCYTCHEDKVRADELAHKENLRAEVLAECAKYPAINTSIASEDRWADDWRDEARGLE